MSREYLKLGPLTQGWNWVDDLVGLTHAPTCNMAWPSSPRESCPPRRPRFACHHVSPPPPPQTHTHTRAPFPLRSLVAFWLGASPSTYQYCWLIKCLALFTMRWFSYRSRGLHYMMLEFCYAGNILAAAQIFWAPSSPLLRRLAFAHMAGPLMWSIVAMRNSLVFHDVDKVGTLEGGAMPEGWSRG